MHGGSKMYWRKYNIKSKNVDNKVKQFCLLSLTEAVIYVLAQVKPKLFRTRFNVRMFNFHAT